MAQKTDRLADEAFDAAYSEAMQFVAPYATGEVQSKICHLEHSLEGTQNFDYLYYLERSRIRFRRFLHVPLQRGSSWLDVGVQFPVLPITLALLGFQVSALEDYSFYPAEIQELYARTTAKYGVEFINRNFSNSPADLGRQFDYITLMAVIEHLPYTPRILLENVHKHLHDDGVFLIDVPNVYWAYTMRGFFLGRHLQIPIEALYSSGIPNLLHHREYSTHDLRYVLRRAGFSVTQLETLNYSYDAPWFAWLSPVFLLNQLPPWREVLYAVCTKQDPAESRSNRRGD